MIQSIFYSYLVLTSTASFLDNTILYGPYIPIPTNKSVKQKCFKRCKSQRRQVFSRSSMKTWRLEVIHSANE